MISNNYDTAWNLLDIAWQCVSRAHAICEDEERFDAQAMARADEALQEGQISRAYRRRRMKRSPLLRRTALRRSSAPRTRRKAVEPGQLEFKLVRDGICRVCGTPGLVRRHHVVLEQRVRREGGNPWDLANSMWVGVTCQCHARHHSAFAKIPIERVPDHAVAWAVDLLGEDAAVAYFRSRYAA